MKRFGLLCFFGAVLTCVGCRTWVDRAIEIFDPYSAVESHREETVSDVQFRCC